MAQHDAHHGATEAPDGLHELAAAQHEDLGAQDARIADPAAESDDHHESGKARPEDGDDTDGEEDEWEGELGVRHRHDELVDAPSAIARGEPEGGADEAAHDHRGQPDHQRDARAENHAREDVTAEVIGAEEMWVAVRALEGGWLEPDAQRLPLGILDDPRRDDGEHGEESDEAQA